MPVQRLEAAFRDAISKGRLAIVPFLTAGFPTAKATVDAAVALAEAGASALELGIPFSDPIADGPVIQDTYQRALASGTGPKAALAMAAEIRARSDIPVVLMTYANPVVRYGAEAFAAAAAKAGVDGVLLTDVPPEELPGTWGAMRAAGLATILLVTPLTRPERLERIVADASGYVYVVSRTGVTGSGEAAAGLETLLRGLRARTPLPIAVGFGIEAAEHVRRFKGIADGVIVGTALMKRLRDAAPGGEAAAAVALYRELAPAAG